jgi:hypothetical protein
VLVSAILTQIRTALDSDSTELPDAACIYWINEAENRCYEAIKDSSFFRASTANNSSAATALLTVTTVTEPVAILGPLWELVPIDYESALRRWPLNADPTAATRTTGEPTHWSVTYTTGAAVVQLWPAPTAVESFIVKGYRAFVPIAAGTDMPDFPTQIQFLLGEYACSKAYVLQQDATSAQLVMARFEGELDIIQRQLNRPSLANRYTLGGDRSIRGPGYRYPDGRLRMPWE